MTPLDRLLTKIDPLFKPPPFDPAQLPPGMPVAKTHRQLLEKRNGGYFWGGALHVLGACAEPEFHGLIPWNAGDLWRKPYGEAAEGLFFFAEDAFGDQFALDAGGKVYQFLSEQGLAKEVADDFDQWLLMVVEATDELLARETFAGWAADHGKLPHGHQLQAYPPFSFAGEDDAVALEPVDAIENMLFHADIARAIADIPEGVRVKIEFTDEGMQIVHVPADGSPEGDEPPPSNEGAA
jgi:hypothetical protein